MHYHSRWEAHMNSQKLEAEQKTKLLAKINKLEQSKSTLKDYAWLSQASSPCDYLCTRFWRLCRSRAST